MPRYLLTHVAFVLMLPPFAQAQAPRPAAPMPADDLPAGALARLGTVRLRHPDAITSLAFSTKTLAVAGSSGAISILEAETGRLVRELPRGTGSTVLFSPDGKHLVCDGRERGLLLVDVDTGQALRSFGGKFERFGRRADDWVGRYGVALAPDGKLLAAVTGTDVVLWDVASGREVRRFQGHKATAIAVAFSADGKNLATGDGVGWKGGVGLPEKGDTTIILWDVATGKETGRIPNAHVGYVFALAFAPDGKTLASSSTWGSRMWDLATRTVRAKHDSGGESVAFSADGKLLAIASGYGGMDRGYTYILDVATGKERHVLRGHVTSVHAVAFAPEGNTLATGGPEGTIRLWDAAAGRELARQDAHQAEVTAVAYSRSGALVATASGGDHSIRVWKTATAALVAKIDISCPYPSHWCPTRHGVGLAFDADGKTLLCDDQAFDLATGRKVQELPGPMLAQSPDGKLLAGRAHEFSSRREARLALWDRATGREVATFAPFGKSGGFDAHVSAAAFAPDGRLLAIGALDSNDPGGTGEAPPLETLFVYEIASGKLLRKFRPDSTGPIVMRFSPDGALLATSGKWSEPVQLWRVATGQEHGQIAPTKQWRHWREIRPIAFSLDSKLLALGGADNSVVLWDVAAGKEAHVLLGHQKPVRSLAFAPNGRALLSGGADTVALIWDLKPPLMPMANVDGAEPLEVLWRELAGDDATAAYRALWQLVAAGDEAASFLKDRVKPLPAPNVELVLNYIADLDSPQFGRRKTAFAELDKLGLLAEVELRLALDRGPSLETRLRLEKLLEKLRRHVIPAEELRQLRVIQVLERLVSPAAADLLEVLARGSPALRTTRGAEAALRRLSGRRMPPAPAALQPHTRPALAAEPRQLPGSKGEVTAVAFAPDGKTLATASVDGLVRLIDAAMGQVRRQLEADPKGVLATTFSPDGKSLATAGRDGVIRLWDPATGQQVASLKGHTAAVTSVSFAPDGKTLASGSVDRSVRLWDLATQLQVGKLDGHEDPVTAVSFAPDGKTLASGDLTAGENLVNGKKLHLHWSNGVRLWDLATRKEIARFDSGHTLAFSPSGRLLAGGEFSTELFVGGTHVIRSSGCLIGEEGETILRGFEALVLWDPVSGESRLRLATRGTALAFSPDGRFLATARGTDLHHGGHLLQANGVAPGDGRLRLLELATGQEVLEFPADAQPAVLAFAPDGRTLATGSKDGRVLLWSLTPRGLAKEPPNAAEQRRLWLDLAAENATRAYHALWRMRAIGPDAVVFLKERLQPTRADDAGLHKVIDELTAESFATREAAATALRRRGADAVPALGQALKKASSSIMRQRLRDLLSAPEMAEFPDSLARARALAVLESTDSPAARDLLSLLASGPPQSRQTREAQAALARATRAPK